MRRALAIAVFICVTALLIWGALHVFIRPVNPEQETPSGHFAGSCWACHFVSENAKIVEK